MPFKKVENFLKEGVAKKRFPGAVCWVGDMEKTYFFESYGNSRVIPLHKPMTKDMIFDLASLTKPICTATLITMLYEENLIHFDDKIAKFIPEFKAGLNGDKIIKELLIHTTGLPGWFPLYLLSRKERWNYLARVNTGLKRVIYSCLGYIILGKIIENITGEKLNRFFEKKVVKKIGLQNTGFNPQNKNNIAPTEMGNLYEKMLARKYGDTGKIAWRDYLITGEVHDGNAYYCFEGVAGNAGLFSNVLDLAKLMRAYLKGELVNRLRLNKMIQPHTRGKEKRGLGWVIDPFPGHLPKNSFGHTGFTGTMLLAVPGRNLIIILLTNAVHPEVKLNIMKPVRAKLVQMISKIMGFVNR